MTEDWERRLRDHGFRITPQRQLVLEAVESLRHGTPEEILVEVQRTASGVNLSTIYRTLEVLERHVQRIAQQTPGPADDHRGDGVAGEVVVRGPQPAAHDDGVGVGQHATQHGLDAGEVVAHLGLEQRVDARRGELLTDIAIGRKIAIIVAKRMAQMMAERGEVFVPAPVPTEASSRRTTAACDSIFSTPEKRREAAGPTTWTGVAN